MRIARVFPRRTNATPTDDLAFIGAPDLFSQYIEVDEVHISVTFSWDVEEAERLYKDWKHIAPVKMGGPAMGQRGEDFTAGMYLKEGYVITSRGCANRCWFCSVWKREGTELRELPVTDGWIIQDDNLLSCSENHIREVFAMLSRQKKQAIFSGGLEARKLQKWHCEELLKLKLKQMFFAYDTPDDKEPLFEAGKMLFENGFSRKAQNLRCYVLIGYPKDTFEAAEKRLTETMQAGFMPFAMLCPDNTGSRDPDWIRFAWPWQRPAAISAKYKALGEKMIDKDFVNKEYTADQIFCFIDSQKVNHETGVYLIETFAAQRHIENDLKIINEIDTMRKMLDEILKKAKYK